MLILFTVLLAAALTWLQVRANSWLRLTAAPRKDRWHAEPTPTSGGLAIFLSVAAAYWLACPGRYPAIAIAAAAIWVLGFVDDRCNLGARLKLFLQTPIAIAVVLTGVVFPLTTWYSVNAALSVFWLVFIPNALNLIDNMDGLCAGVVVIICLSRCGLLISGGYGTDATLWAILGAAFAAFLVFNHNPARIFMGDCGSVTVGFVLAALTLAGPPPLKSKPLGSFLYPALTFAYPIFDTVFVVLLRRLAGRPLFAGGRDHTSHRLVFMGLDQRHAVWFLWLLTALGSSVGIMICRMPGMLLPAATALFGLFGILGLSLARVPGHPQPALVRQRRRAASV